jgi:hypothetical protein
VEQYDRIDGFKVLAVFEDHTGGGSARIFYAVHPDGRGLVLIGSRNPAHADMPRRPRVFPDHADARRAFTLEVERYIPARSSVI